MEQSTAVNRDSIEPRRAGRVPEVFGDFPPAIDDMRLRVSTSPGVLMEAWIKRGKREMAAQRRAPVVTIKSVAVCLAVASLLACGGSRDQDHRSLALEYVKQEKIAAALEQLEKIDRPTSDDYSWRGELLIQQGRSQFDKAAAAFHDALRADSQSSRALYGLALLAVFNKEYPRAEEFARKAVEIQPNAPHPRNLLAAALMHQEKYEEAEALLLALEREPAIAPIATGNLGELYLRRNNLDLAEAKLKEAIGSQPDNWDWHRSLGDVYRLQGKKNAALSEYRRTLELLEKGRWVDVPLIEGVRARINELEKG